jgi:hypothetical protein
MGVFNQRTGELQEGILDQKKSAEDTLDMLHTHGVIDAATYEKAKTSSLGAQQKMIGISTAEFNTKLQAQLEYQRAMDVAKLGEQGAQTRQGMSGATTIQAEQMRLDAEKALADKKTAAAAGGKVLQEKTAPTPVPSFLPKVGLGDTDRGNVKLFRQ